MNKIIPDSDIFVTTKETAKIPSIRKKASISIQNRYRTKYLIFPCEKCRWVQNRYGPYLNRNPTTKQQKRYYYGPSFKTIPSIWWSPDAMAWKNTGIFQYSFELVLKEHRNRFKDLETLIRESLVCSTAIGKSYNLPTQFITINYSYKHNMDGYEHLHSFITINPEDRKHRDHFDKTFDTKNGFDKKQVIDAKRIHPRTVDKILQIGYPGDQKFDFIYKDPSHIYTLIKRHLAGQRYKSIYLSINTSKRFVEMAIS